MPSKPFKRPAARPLRWLRHPLTPWLAGVGLVLSLTNLYPLAELAWRAVTVEGSVSAENLRWLASRRVGTALGHSLLVSGAATLFALAGGLLLALFTTRTDVLLGRAVRLAFLLPLVVPPQVLAIAWLQWAGPVGYL